MIYNNYNIFQILHSYYDYHNDYHNDSIILYNLLTIYIYTIIIIKFIFIIIIIMFVQTNKHTLF